MKNFFHRADMTFALLLAFFLSWYNVLSIIQAGYISWLAIGRLLINFVFIFVLLEIMFALICYVRKKPLFGNTNLTFFSLRAVLPIAVFLSGASSLFYFLAIPKLTVALGIGLAVGFVVGTILSVLYFYSLVEKR